MPDSSVTFASPIVSDRDGEEASGLDHRPELSLGRAPVDEPGEPVG